MYIPPAFAIDRTAAIALLRERGFGLLVLASAADAPAGVHAPFLVEERAGGSLRVELHVARANRLHTRIGDGSKALLACQGPDAYISPDWYGVPNQVPTWTYTAVHLTGTARLLPETETLGHVDRLSAFFESRLAPKPPWTSAKMDEGRLAAMLKAIVVIAIEVETVEGSRKLIQHKGEIEHRGAIAGLSGGPDAGSLAIADMMRETLAKKFGRAP